MEDSRNLQMFLNDAAQKPPDPMEKVTCDGILATVAGGAHKTTNLRLQARIEYAMTAAQKSSTMPVSKHEAILRTLRKVWERMLRHPRCDNAKQARLALVLEHALDQFEELQADRAFSESARGKAFFSDVRVLLDAMKSFHNARHTFADACKEFELYESQVAHRDRKEFDRTWTRLDPKPWRRYAGNNHPQPTPTSSSATHRCIQARGSLAVSDTRSA